MPEVKTIVRENVVTATPSTAVSDVAQLMDDENVGSIVIVDEDRPQGIITDRDIAIETAARGNDPTATTAADVMSENLVVVDIESGIFDVISAMKESSVRRIPAVDETGRIAGIVTFDDFIVLLGRELKNLADIAEAEAPPYEHAR